MEVNTELIDLQTLASGDVLQLKIYKLQGEKRGRKTYIQANLHGAEIVGNAVIYELINYFFDLDSTEIEGEILLIPVCNPTGVNQRNSFFSTGRYSPYDGNDWNRIFWDYLDEKSDLDQFIAENINNSKQEIQKNYSQQIINTFKHKINNFNSRGLSFSAMYRNQLHSLSLDANYVIDIHSSSVLAIDYLYCFDRRYQSADSFLFDYAILMNQYDGYAFDEAFLNPWLALEKKFVQAGRNITFDVESWTLELGSGMQVNEKSVSKGVAGIINYLSGKNIIHKPFLLPKKQTKLIPKNTLQNYYAPQGGIIRHRLSAGTKINQGDILYELLSFSKNSNQPKVTSIRSVDQGIIYDVSVNDTVNQGEYILGIFPHV